MGMPYFQKSQETTIRKKEKTQTRKTTRTQPQSKKFLRGSGRPPTNQLNKRGDGPSSIYKEEIRGNTLEGGCDQKKSLEGTKKKYRNK